MSRDRKAAELMAGTIALRAGLDPFESSLAAGINAACAGRLYEPAPRCARPAYALGFELGRHCLLDVTRPSLPSVLEAESILGLCRSRCNAS